MTTSFGSRGASRLFLPVAAVFLIGLVLFAYLRRPVGDEASGRLSDGLSYEHRVTPLVEEGARIVTLLQSTNSLGAALKAGAELRGRWQVVRTAAGYDRARHDGFILTFSQFFNVMQSAELISAALNAAPGANGGIPEDRRMELLFALQGVHGAETAAQLVSKTGLPVDALLSRTNLVRELNASGQSAIIQHGKARQVLDQLQPAKGL